MNFFNDIGNALNPNTNGLTNSINNTNARSNFCASL